MVGVGPDADCTVGAAAGGKPDPDIWLIHCVAVCGRTIANTTAATPLTARATSVTRPTATRNVRALRSRVPSTSRLALAAAQAFRPKLDRRHSPSRDCFYLRLVREAVGRGARMSRFNFPGSPVPLHAPAAARIPPPARSTGGPSSMDSASSGPLALHRGEPFQWFRRAAGNPGSYGPHNLASFR